MKPITLTIAAVLAAVTFAPAVGGATSPSNDLLVRSADVAPAALLFGRDVPSDATLEQAQWFYGGRNYCFYPNGWHGPGYYWCGYAWRRGFGWGGGYGWHGWRGGGYRGGFHGGGYHGGGYHGGDFHGGGFHGGGGSHGGGGFHDGGHGGGGFHGGGGEGGDGHHH